MTHEKAFSRFYLCFKNGFVEAAIEKKWNDILPNQPYSHVFLDSYVETAYTSENNTGETFLYFLLLG